MSDRDDQETPGSQRAGRWERRLGVISLVLILVGLGAVVLNWWTRHRGPGGGERQRVLADLEPVPCIALAPAALRDWNVLLISMDTTRANHLNCYGYQYTKTPVLNNLARHGVLYSHAFTPSPATLPAHASLLTGLYPLHHGVRANGTFTLDDAVVTLAETLRASGYRTGAAVSAFVLDSQFGVDQGFDTYDDDLTVGMKYAPHMFRERAAELTNVPVSRWLRAHGKDKFFFWVHYFDPHAPYAPPEPYRTEYAKGPYDGEIDYTDAQIGKLLAVLDELGVRDRTLVIVVADHGEGLGQHGEQTHSLLIYDSTLHVPMIFSGPPPLPQGRVVHEQVCLVDVMPTVLELLGAPVPKGLDGVSLLREVGRIRPAICIETLATMVMHGWAPLIGVRRLDCKFILAPTKELYRLRDDPLEEANVHDSDPELAKELFGQLTELVGSGDPYVATAVAREMAMDEETRRKLESLGYVASGTAEDKPPETLPDPKEMVQHWERVQHGINLKLAGRVRKGAEILEECVAKVPKDIFARQNLAGCYSLMGERDKAVTVLEPALAFPQERTSTLVLQAGLQLQKNEIELAEATFREVLKAEPENTEVLLSLARITYLRGDADKALADLKKIIEINPGTAGPAAYNQIGMIHLRAGRHEESRQAFKAALEIDGLNGPAHDGLANILIDEKKYDEAMGHLRLALRFNPLQLAAMASLGGLYREQGSLVPAAAWCRQALAINPDFPMALNNLGLIYRQQDNLDEAEKQYRRALQVAPRMAALHINLAHLLVAKGDEQSAGAEFLAAVRGDPNDVRALANLATFAYRRSQLTRAAGYYRRALRLQPDYALAHKYLGLICAQIGQPRASVRHLERALELAPDDDEADQLRQVIAKMQAVGVEPADAPANGSPAADGRDPIERPAPEIDPVESADGPASAERQ